MNTLVNEAADLMAQFDRNAANVFRTQPFNRVAIAKAFRIGFRAHSAHTLRVCDLLDQVAAADVQSRRLAA